MANGIRWIKDIEVEEISAVDLAANRKRFRHFKRVAGEGRGSAQEKARHAYHTAAMERCLKHLLDQGYNEERAHKICYAAMGEGANKEGKVARRLHGKLLRGKQQEEELEEAPPAEEPMAEGAPEAVIEEGVTLYPWEQCIGDMTTAHSTDDAPRICGAMLAKFGEGPQGEIRLPSGMDPVEAAQQAIEEGKALMKEDPLLRPEPRKAATTATKSAVRAALREVFGELDLGKLLAGFKAKTKTKATKAGAATAEAGTETDTVEKLLAEIQKLNAALLGKEPKPKGKPKGEEDEEALTEEELKVLGLTPPADKEEDDEEDEEEGGAEGAGAKEDEEEDEEEGAEASVPGTKRDRQIRALTKAVGLILERIDEIEAQKPRRSGGRTKAIHLEDDDDEPEVTRGHYRSTILGADIPRGDVVPFLTKRTADKWKKRAGSAR